MLPGAHHPPGMHAAGSSACGSSCGVHQQPRPCLKCTRCRVAHSSSQKPGHCVSMLWSTAQQPHPPGCSAQNGRLVWQLGRRALSPQSPAQWTAGAAWQPAHLLPTASPQRAAPYWLPEPTQAPAPTAAPPERQLRAVAHFSPPRRVALQGQRARVVSFTTVDSAVCAHATIAVLDVRRAWGVESNNSTGCCHRLPRT
jgi:hypothetical protein